MQKRLLCFALVTLVSSQIALQAQTLSIEQFTLPNGMRVVLNEDHSAPLVAVNVWYHVGSKNERPGRTGFAHLFEHMLFSGSEHVGNNEHFRHVQSVGGTLNGSTNFDRTNYFETLPSNYLPLGLWLESDRMGFFLSALDQKKLDIQKEVVKEERRQRYDNVPYGTAFERTLRLGYSPDYPYHWPTIGSMADLTAAQLEDVKGFFRTYYSPNNAVLTLVGDFDKAEARSLVEKYFGDIPQGLPVPRFNAVRAPMGGEKREVVPSPVALPRVYRLYHIPKAGEHEWYAADLLTTVLAGDKSSRLTKALVYDQQIAQDVTAWVFPSEATGLMIVSSTARPGVSAERLERALDTELGRIAAGGMNQDELTRAMNVTETQFAHQLENFGQRADFIGMTTTFFNDPNYINSFLDRYRAVSRGDLSSVLTRYLVPENRVTLHFVPEKPAAGAAAKGGK